MPAPSPGTLRPPGAKNLANKSVFCGFFGLCIFLSVHFELLFLWVLFVPSYDHPNPYQPAAAYLTGLHAAVKSPATAKTETFTNYSDPMATPTTGALASGTVRVVALVNLWPVAGRKHLLHIRTFWSYGIESKISLHHKGGLDIEFLAMDWNMLQCNDLRLGKFWLNHVEYPFRVDLCYQSCLASSRCSEFHDSNLIFAGANEAVPLPGFAQGCLFGDFK